jgi:hypothetical protein
VEKEERHNWFSTLDRSLAIGRLMLEDVCANDGGTQIPLLVPSLSPLHQETPDGFFKSCVANDCEFSLCRLGVDHCQIPCTTETKTGALHRCKDAESILGPLENVERRDKKTVAIRICGMKHQALHSVSVNDILKNAVSLFGTRHQTVFDKNFWNFLKNHRSFETSKSILLQVAGEVSGDLHASERLKGVHWRMKANFGDVKNERDNAAANDRVQTEQQQVVDLHTKLHHETATTDQPKQRALELESTADQRALELVNRVHQLERCIEEGRRTNESVFQQINELRQRDLKLMHQRDLEPQSHRIWECRHGELQQHLEEQQRTMLNLKLQCDESMDDIELEFYILEFTTMVNDLHFLATIRRVTGWQTHSAPLLEPAEQQQLLDLFKSKLPKIAKSTSCCLVRQATWMLGR